MKKNKAHSHTQTRINAITANQPQVETFKFDRCYSNDRQSLFFNFFFISSSNTDVFVVAFSLFIYYCGNILPLAGYQCRCMIIYILMTLFLCKWLLYMYVVFQRRKHSKCFMCVKKNCGIVYLCCFHTSLLYEIWRELRVYTIAVWLAQQPMHMFTFKCYLAIRYHSYNLFLIDFESNFRTEYSL